MERPSPTSRSTRGNAVYVSTPCEVPIHVGATPMPWPRSAPDVQGRLRSTIGKTQVQEEPGFNRKAPVGRTVSFDSSILPRLVFSRILSLMCCVVCLLSRVSCLLSCVMCAQVRATHLTEVREHAHRWRWMSGQQIKHRPRPAARQGSTLKVARTDSLRSCASCKDLVTKRDQLENEVTQNRKTKNRNKTQMTTCLTAAASENHRKRRVRRNATSLCVTSGSRHQLTAKNCFLHNP